MQLVHLGLHSLYIAPLRHKFLIHRSILVDQYVVNALQLCQPLPADLLCPLLLQKLDFCYYLLKQTKLILLRL